MKRLAAIVLLSPGLALGQPWFSDITREAGVDFVHFNGMTGELLFAEMMGAGGALADFDNDGDLDLYLIQGGRFGHAPDGQHCDRLLRNELIPSGKLAFVDASDGLDSCACHYGMGAATGDVDNDGDIDLYLANFGSNQLLLNDGTGALACARDRNAGDERWSVAASFSDYDNDGWLDLYIANYTDFALDNQRKCFNEAAELEYCGPNAYKPIPDRLLHNTQGKGFDDVTAATGIAASFGAGLGVVAADFNGDRRQDFFVANDQGLNLLWINNGDQFADEALLGGVAVNMEGKAEASMGVDAADFDGDGDVDLFMTHLARETNTLYVNDGTGLFEDRTLSFGLGGLSLPYTGFGTAWRDFDNDGDLDLFVANGAVMRIDEQIAARDPLPLRESNRLYEYRDGQYFDISTGNPAVAGPLAVSRGAIFGDLDNDGDTDIVVTNNNGPAQVLRNDTGASRCWIGARITDAQLARDVYGAEVRLASGPWRRVRSDGSYVAANDPRVILPMADCTAGTLIVRWPGGELERFGTLAPRRYHELVRGKGERLDP